jgi:hypothetical protein
VRFGKRRPLPTQEKHRAPRGGVPFQRLVLAAGTSFRSVLRARLLRQDTTGVRALESMEGREDFWMLGHPLSILSGKILTSAKPP